MQSWTNQKCAYILGARYTLPLPISQTLFPISWGSGSETRCVVGVVTHIDSIERLRWHHNITILTPSKAKGSRTGRSMAAEQKLPSCTPGPIATQFNHHGNCATVTVDTVVLGKFQAACVSEITVELTTVYFFCLAVLWAKRNITEHVCSCFTACDVKCNHSIVMAVTTHSQPYAKEGVESLCILLYTSLNVCIVNGQQLKVNSQSPENQCGQRSNAKRMSWSKFLTCGRSHDYRVYGSAFPCILLDEFKFV